MDNQTLQRIKDILSRSQRLAVAVGKNPTIDDMGAALALYLSFQSMGKTVTVISGTEPLVEISNLVGIDKVKTRYETDGADLVVSFPYKEGEIEKVSYTIDNGYLNIVVKAGDQGLTFQEREVKYARGGGSGGGQLDALFAIGVPRLSDLQGMFDMDTLKDVTIVNIDNKQDNQGFGDVVLVSPRFSSVSEQVAQLLADLNTEPDIDVAQNLLDGISGATDNFQSPQTSFLAFEMAGILMRHGALRAKLQPAPRRDFATPPVASMPARPAPMTQMSDRGTQLRQPLPPQMPDRPSQSHGGQPQPQRRPQQQQQGQQDRRQQFEERRQQFQDRRSQQHPQPRFNQPAQGAMQQPMQQPMPAPQPRFNQPAPQGDIQNSQEPVSTAMPNFPSQGTMQQPASSATMQSPTSQGAGQNPVGQSQSAPDLNPPSDWLTPKVYKGSTNI